jgi:disulfide oxidoreductase YuzD
VGIKKIGDLVDKNGAFLSPDALKEKFSLPHCNFLEYLSIRQCIPYKWKQQLQKGIDNELDSDYIYIALDDEVVSLGSSCKKDIYWELFKLSHKKPVKGFEN